MPLLGLCLLCQLHSASLETPRAQRPGVGSKQISQHGPWSREGLCLALCPQLFCAEPVMYRKLWTGLRQAEGRGRLNFIIGRTGADGGDFT